VQLTKDTLDWADCVVVHTAHSAYDWNWVARYARLVFDTRAVMWGVQGMARVVTL